MSQSSLDNVPDFAKAIIGAFIDGTKVSFVFLMLGTVYASLLVPLLFSLFAFSTRTTRRQPMFILVTMGVLLGIALGLWNGYLEASVLTSPFTLGDNIAKKVWAFGFVFSMAPWLIDMVLLLRLVAVYPPHTMSIWTSIAIFAFPCMVKPVRLVVIILFFVETWKNLEGTALTTMMFGGFTLPYTKIEFTLQIFDNAYVSAMFLLKLRSSLRKGLVLSGTSGSISSRIRTLFWIAASNFVFPVAFNIAQVVVMFTAHDTPIPSYLMWTNIYVSIIGLVFATVWSNSTNPDTQRVQTSNAISTAFRSTAGPFSIGNNHVGALAFARSGTTAGDTIDITGAARYVDESDTRLASEEKENSVNWEKKPQDGDVIPLTVRIDESRTISHV